jgi:hypothetical protein
MNKETFLLVEGDNFFNRNHEHFNIANDVIIKNVKSVPDLIPNSDLIMNKLSLNSNSTVKEYNLGSQFDAKLKRWIPSFSFPKKIYSGDDDYP